MNGISGRESARVEALSDGVFAVAITLLVLEIGVPHDLRPNQSLTHALLALWPAFTAFVLSFVTIGIMWMNHHRIFGQMVRSDDGLQVLNGLLLLLITFVPFPTAVFAGNLTTTHASEAAVFYSGTFVVLAVLFNVLTAYARRRNLFAVGPDTNGFARQLRAQYLVGPVFYSVITGVAFFNAYACLGLHVLVALYFAIPPATWAVFHARRRGEI